MIPVRVALVGLVGCVALYAGLVGAALSAQVQTCGQGVVLRAGGSLVIDGWTNYTMPIVPGGPGGLTPAPPTTVSGLKPTPYPTAVVFGQSLHHDLKVCVELENGSRCLELIAVRRIIGK